MSAPKLRTVSDPPVVEVRTETDDSGTSDSSSDEGETLRRVQPQPLSSALSNESKVQELKRLVGQVNAQLASDAGAADTAPQLLSPTTTKPARSKTDESNSGAGVVENKAARSRTAETRPPTAAPSEPTSTHTGSGSRSPTTSAEATPPPTKKPLRPSGADGVVSKTQLPEAPKSPAPPPMPDTPLLTVPSPETGSPSPGPPDSMLSPVPSPVPPDDSDDEGSVDGRLMQKGFGSESSDDTGALSKTRLRKPSDDVSNDDNTDASTSNALETDDWAEQELRELRRNVKENNMQRKLQRRETLNGIEVAPRSALSPPLSPPGGAGGSEAAAPVEDDASFELQRKKLTLSLKFKSSGNIVRAGQRSADAAAGGAGGGVAAPGSTKLSRLGSSLRGLAHNNQPLANKSPRTPSASNTPSLSRATAATSAAAVRATEALLQSGTAQELFRYVLDKALDADEKGFHSYVFTLAYFTDPVRVLSDLITEHDLLLAVARSSKRQSGGLDDDDAASHGEQAAERPMKVISFWVSHLWYQFEASEPLVTLLTHFVEGSLKKDRWGERLRDTMKTLQQRVQELRNSSNALQDHALNGADTKDDLLAEMDPEAEFALLQPGEQLRQEGGARSGAGAGAGAATNDTDSDEDATVAASAVDVGSGGGDVRSTFVGGETYTGQSKPMGLAALMESSDSPPINATTTFVGGGAYTAKSKPMGIADLGTTPDDEDGKASDELVRSVSPEDPNQKSRPMGLAGLIQPEDEVSLFDPSRKNRAAPELSFNEENSAQQGAGSRLAADIARQLTLIEIVQWKMVSPLELQRALWKNESEESAPNIRRLINWHNRIVSWVQTEVLTGAQRSDRTRTLKAFLCIALRLERLQNYHTLFGIMAGLKVNLVSRLHLEEELQPKWRSAFDRLTAMASTRNNWAVYRQQKAKATRFPFLPYIGLYLSDLQLLETRDKTFLAEGNDVKVVNFAKMRRLGELLQEMVYVQRGSEYRFKMVPRILSYLLASPQSAEHELWSLSLRLRDSASSVSGNHLLSQPGSSRASGEGSRQRSASVSNAFQQWQGNKESFTDSGTVSPLAGSSPRTGSPRTRVSPSGTMSGRTSPRERPSNAMSPSVSRKQRLASSGTVTAASTQYRQHMCPVCQTAFKEKDELLKHLESRQCRKKE